MNDEVQLIDSRGPRCEAGAQRDFKCQTRKSGAGGKRQMTDWRLVDPFDDGIRPAGPKDTCFYCWQKVGEPHRRDCIVVTKVVRFRVSAEVDITVPHSWTEEQIRSFNCYEEVMGTLRESECRLDGPDPYSLEYVGVIDQTP